MPVVESVVDIDVTCDVSNEGTFAFDDDKPVEGDSFTSPENDQERLVYMEDVFGSSTGDNSRMRRVKVVHPGSRQGTIRQLLQLLGLSLERKSRQSISVLCKKLVYGTDQITEEGIVSSRKHGRANYS
jgi:hypothetical protein